MHIDKFITHLRVERRYSPNTISAYQNDLAGFFEFGRELCVDNEDHDNKQLAYNIRLWIVHLMELGYTPLSVRRKISSLSSYYRFLNRRGIVSGNPTDRILLPKTGKKLPGFITEQKLNSLLDTVDFGDDFTGVRNHLIIEFLWITGVRRSELAALKNSDINFNALTISVSGKGDKQRVIPITQSTAVLIRNYIILRDQVFGDPEKEGALFVTVKNRPLYPELIYRVVNRYISVVSPGKNRGPHILRHSFATHMLNRGADLNSIKDIMGHSSLASTEVYTHNTFEKLKKIYKQAHPRA